jgi:hypothetical protein
VALRPGDFAAPAHPAERILSLLATPRSQRQGLGRPASTAVSTTRLKRTRPDLARWQGLPDGYAPSQVFPLVTSASRAGIGVTPRPGSEGTGSRPASSTNGLVMSVR